MALRPDIAEAFGRVPFKMGLKRAVRNLEGRLHEGEVVRRLAMGGYAGGTGLVALTSHRVLFVRDDMSKQKVADFRLSPSLLVAYSSSMLGGLSVTQAGNTVTARSMDNREGEVMAEAIRGAIAEAAVGESVAETEQPASDVEPTGDPLALLGMLRTLHGAGVLTEEEYAAKKALLTARL